MSIDNAPLEESLWYATAAPPPETAPIEGGVEADVCIVGAGYTGLSSALHLGECGVRCAVLEAQQIGHGGSGRNAGHCTPTFHFYEIAKIREMLDEPFASLDAPTAERLRRLLIEIWSLRPTTVLFVTHDLREAIHLADRIVFLSAGPAHVIADIPIDLPRPRRGDAEVDAIRAQLLTDHGPELTQILTS